MSRARTIAVVVAALLMAAAFYSFRTSSDPPPARSDAPVARGTARNDAPGAAAPLDADAPPVQSSSVPTGGSATPIATASTPAATPAEDEAMLQQPQVVALGRRAADEYRQRAQYPPWSSPFGDEGEDPILRDRQVSPITAAGPNGEDPTLVVFPDQVSVEAPDPVLLYAYLSVNDTPVPAGRIVGAVMNESLQPLAELIYVDDGSGGDRRAGDFLYTARFEAGAEFAPELSESFLVRVEATTPEGDLRHAATGFLYSNPHARLTGRYRDAIDQGSLVIDAEVEVFRPGRFHLEGTLYSQDGSRGLAEAHTAAELAPGRQWMRLVFFGRILNQAGVDGPYLLRFLALSTTTGMPNAKNRLVENAHLTGPYRAAQFSVAPFNDQDLLDAANRLEGDLQAPSP